MKVFQTVLFASILIFPVLASAQGDEQFIDWSSGKRLNWKDYLARPSSSSVAAAITSTALGVEYHFKNNTLSYKITCRFSKTRSWGKYKTDYILQHEQGHFDITELFARRLAKELKGYSFNPRSYQDDLSKIYKNVMDDKERFQNQYDAETDFSRNKEKQTEWLDKIREELEETAEFANYFSLASPTH
jgi:Bacterial protein of unknown function (DUF922)